MNQFNQEITHTLQSYLRLFPEEAANFSVLLRQLDSDEDIAVRSNMTGHVTASVAVLDHTMQHLLLVHHKGFDLWLPPGGHYEAPESLWDSAQREAEEETGVTGLVLHPWCVNHALPFDVDSHAVPASASKNEAAHMHHDFRFLAIADAATPLVAQLQEVHDAKWVPLSALRSNRDRRMQTLLSKLATTGLLLRTAA